MATDLKKELFFCKESSPTTKRVLAALAATLLKKDWVVRGQIVNLWHLGWRFEFNNRKRSLGLCDGRKNIIYVSAHLADQNLHQPLILENTIRHELAHALDYATRGKSDHSYLWKSVARIVLCTAERCYKSNEVVSEKSKYTLTCPNCKTKYAAHKKRRRVSACASCCKKHNGGRFDYRFALTVTQNY